MTEKLAVDLNASKKLFALLFQLTYYLAIMTLKVLKKWSIFKRVQVLQIMQINTVK